jgi:hypothetical protein
MNTTMKNMKTKEHIKDLSLLPNIEGFKFIAVMKNGNLRWSTVQKNEKGLHRVVDFNEMIGWYELSKNENYRCHICKDSGAVRVNEYQYSDCPCLTYDRD